MDLTDLLHFQEIAEFGSLSKAAAKLGVTQPTLTRHLKRLEADFGARLFYRNGRGVSLTPSGERLFAGVRDILIDVTRLKADIASENAEPTGQVRLGLPPSLCAAIGANLALKFQDACPRASLRIHELFSGGILEWVSSGRLDLAVLYDVRRGSNLLISALLEEELFLVQAASCPPPPKPMTLDNLSGYRLLVPSLANGLRRVLQAAMADSGRELEVAVELDSTIVIKQLVERGEGATVLPYGAVYREVRDGRLRADRIGPPALTALLVTATPALQPISVATERLMKLLTAEVADCLRHDILRGKPQRMMQRAAGARRGAQIDTEILGDPAQ